MRKGKTTTYASLAAAVLAIALVGAVLGWTKDHLRLSSDLKKAVEAQGSHVQENAIATLTRQRTDDVATIQQLKTSLDRKTAAATQLASELKVARENLATKQSDDAFLQSHFDDLKIRFDREVSDESRYYLLYTGWKEVGLNQREYIRGLYVDDSALRNAARQSPYAPFSFSDPDAASNLSVSADHHPAVPAKN